MAPINKVRHCVCISVLVINPFVPEYQRLSAELTIVRRFTIKKKIMSCT